MNTQNTVEICSKLDVILSNYSNINFITKHELYLLLDYIRFNFNISVDNVFNITSFYKNNFRDIVELTFHGFNDVKIGGFLVKNKFPEKSHIVVNENKDRYSMLFDLTHELMHYLLHPEDRENYISSSLCDIDNFEWQANEGAAELMVPYRKFIPIFCDRIKYCKNYLDYSNLIKVLAEKFVVSPAVIEYRISGLKYEISQYEAGINIDRLDLLSKTAQEAQNIYIDSYSKKFRQKSNLGIILRKNRSP